jgi:aspartate/methionine/tyrosine aminotransferase
LWLGKMDDANRAMREAVARAYRGVDASEVMVTVGASEADMLVALGLAGPGAHVVVERPAYHALLAPAVALGCRVTRVDRGPDFAQRVADALTRDTRLVLLANPNNPTGDLLSEAELAALGDAAARVGAWVLVDEVFADATEAGDRPARLAHDRILSVGSLTKCLGYSPLRVGWVVAHKDAAEALDRAKGLASVGNPILSLALGARILDQRREILRTTRAVRAEGAALVARAGVPADLKPHGTTCVVRVPGDDRAFAERLLSRSGALVAPGSFIETPRRVRVGLLTPAETLREGLAALAIEIGLYAPSGPRNQPES